MPSRPSAPGWCSTRYPCCRTSRSRSTVRLYWQESDVEIVMPPELLAVVLLAGPCAEARERGLRADRMFEGVAATQDREAMAVLGLSEQQFIAATQEALAIVERDWALIEQVAEGTGGRRETGLRRGGVHRRRGGKLDRRLLFFLGTARVGARRRVDRAAALGQRLAQQPFDLAIGAAQLLRGERLDRGGDGRIEAQQERLAIWRFAQAAPL